MDIDVYKIFAIMVSIIEERENVKIEYEVIRKEDIEQNLDSKN